MLKEEIEQHANKLFGGATITVEPYEDHVITGWDVTIIPKIDGETRFIRVSKASGMLGILDYLKKIQSNLLKLQNNTVVGINVKPQEIDQETINKAIQDKMPTLESLIEGKLPAKPEFTCIDCNFKTKYPGIFAIHNKKHKKAQNPQNSIARAINDPDIYDVRE